MLVRSNPSFHYFGLAIAPSSTPNHPRISVQPQTAVPFMKTLYRLGIFTSIQGIEPSWIPRDIVAGIMLVAIAIPGQIATAHLAGMPPQTGLYAFIAGTLAIALFGDNRYMSVAADSTIAPIFAAAIASITISHPGEYAELVTHLAVLVGIILMAVGILQAGWVADLLSLPVITGFLAGISIHIIVGQLPIVMGIDAPKGHMLYQIVQIIRHAGNASGLDLLIGCLALGSIIVAKRISRKIPGALIGLGMTIALSWFFDWSAHGVAMLGKLPTAWPSFSFHLSRPADLAYIGSLAVAVSLVCMMQTAAVGRAFPSDQNKSDNMSKNFAAVGVGNLFAGLLGAFPVNASPPSTSIVRDAGGCSQLAGLLAAACVLVFTVFCGGLFAYVPMAALSGVLIYVGASIFHIDDIRRVARFGGFESALMFISITMVVLLPIETGVTLSIILSLIHGAHNIIRPVCAELVRIPGSTIWWPPTHDEPGEYVDGVFVFSPSAPVNFANIMHIQSRMMSAIALRMQRAAIHYVVIDASSVTSLDYSGSTTLRALVSILRDRRIDVAIARLSFPQANKAASQAGLLNALGEDHLFHSVEDAVQAFLKRPQ